MRLDQFLAKTKGWSERTARQEILRRVVRVDESVTVEHRREIDKFSRVELGTCLLQEGLRRVYLMTHKRIGVVSATRDPEHPTVLEKIELPERDTLHLAGRLDRSSSGLLLLSNDGRWTSSITAPESHLAKTYLVETDREIPFEAVARFQEGFHFLPEDIQTKPAELQILDPCRALVILREGRYHQIKRMFHRLDGIRLRSLHREQIGDLRLPDDLAPGQWRHLTPSEVSLFLPKPGEKQN